MTLRGRIKEAIEGSIDLTQGTECELIDNIMSIVDSTTIPRKAEPEKTIFEIIFPLIHEILEDGDQSRGLSSAIQTEIEIITVPREEHECVCESLRICRNQAQNMLETLQDEIRVIIDDLTEGWIANWRQAGLKERIYDAVSAAIKPPGKANGDLDISVESYRREIVSKLVEIVELGKREIVNFQEIVQKEMDRRSIITCPSCGNKFVD